MLTDEQDHVLQRDPGGRLLRVLQEVHIAVDAEILLLCTSLDSECELSAQAPDRTLNGWKKVVTVALDLHAAEVLHALRRMKLRTYGRCDCGDELTFEELRTNLAERFCSACRTTPAFQN